MREVDLFTQFLTPASAADIGHKTTELLYSTLFLTLMEVNKLLCIFLKRTSSFLNFSVYKHAK